MPLAAQERPASLPPGMDAPYDPTDPSWRTFASPFVVSGLALWDPSRLTVPNRHFSLESPSAQVCVDVLGTCGGPALEKFH